MRNTPAVARLLTLEEYLAFEEQSPLKHEYIAGEVFAMSGMTTRHNLITLNFVRSLHDAARRRRCRVFATDVKLKAAKDRVYYPDLMVACGRAGEVELIVDEPSIVVEVTSRSTRAIDRREKLDAYQRVPSLRQYLIVEQRRRHVLSYSRDADGAWVREEFAENGEVPLRPLGTELTMDAIYDDVPMPPLTVREGSDEDDDWATWEPVAP
jgi:Uma2 family endonuclease